MNGTSTDVAPPREDGASTLDLARLAGGSALVLLGMLARGWFGFGLAAAGTGLAISAAGRSRGSSAPERRHAPQPEHAMTVDALATITIDASADSLYERWQDLRHLPDLHRHVLGVDDLGGGRSRWQVRGPGRRLLQWDAEIVEDDPGRRLAWRSLPGGDLDHEGEVTFEEAPGNRGTVVTVRLRYAPIGARFGAAFAGLMGHAPSRTLLEDLRRLKQLVETGEVATTSGQPAGRPGEAGKALQLGQQVADALDILAHPLHVEVQP